VIAAALLFNTMLNENKIHQRRNLFVADDKMKIGKLLRRACPVFAGSNLFTAALNRKIQRDIHL